MQRQLDALGLSYQFVEGFDKYDLLTKEDRAAAAEQLDIDNSIVEHICKKVEKGHACTLSHIKVYDLMEKDNVPIACILEDDACLLPSFPKVLAACQKVPWDILMLSSRSIIINEIIVPIFGSLYRANKLKPHKFLCSLYKFLYYKKYYPQLNAYTFRQILLSLGKYTWRKLLLILKGKIKKGLYYRHDLRVGALPVKDKTSWHKISSNHYIAKPYSTKGDTEILSAMAYIVNLPTAIKWRQKAFVSNRGIDLTLNRLPAEANVNLSIVVPPCVIGTSAYTCYSLLDHN